MTIYSKDIDTSGFAIDLVFERDAYFVLSGVLISSSDAIGLYDESKGSNRITNFGDISGVTGIVLAPYDIFINAAGASVIGVNTGLSLGGSNAFASNSGYISGSTGLFVSGSSVTFRNSGDVSGEATGIKVTGSSFSLHNSGVIDSTAGYAIDATQAATTSITNVGLGTINGNLAFGNGDDTVVNTGAMINGSLSLAGGSNSVTNTGGTIRGSINTYSGTVFNNGGAIDGYVAFQAGISVLYNQGGTVNGSITMGGTTSEILNLAGVIEGNITTSSSTLDLANSGTIIGDVTVGGSGGSIVGNTGAIHGNVKFYSNASYSYDGRGGTLNGEVFGGSGADTVRLGNDGETVRGGGGADSLYAGTGADTFIFSHLSSLDVDRVHGFDAARDTIELEQSSFSKLTVDQPVVFAIGQQATRHDYLFYNSVNGGLYYDPDSIGKAAAIIVAHLDPGLNLTSHNFQVVPGQST